MTNEWNTDVDPARPAESGLTGVRPDETRSAYLSSDESTFQRLEDARLGHVFVKAWTEGYKSAEEVIKRC
jgi:hypothetical protein